MIRDASKHGQRVMTAVIASVVTLAILVPVSGFFTINLNFSFANDV